jgi:hypothetical protein
VRHVLHIRFLDEKGLTMNAQRLEMHLEELGEHSWGKALVNTLSGTYGSAQFRFVARPPGEHHHASEDLFVGATFPVMRLQDLDNQVEPNAWLDIARDRLRELDEQLVAAGWHREPQTGRHWWSLTYTAVEPTAGRSESSNPNGAVG